MQPEELRGHFAWTASIIAVLVTVVFLGIQISSCSMNLDNAKADRCVKACAERGVYQLDVSGYEECICQPGPPAKEK